MLRFGANKPAVLPILEKASTCSCVRHIKLDDAGEQPCSVLGMRSHILNGLSVCSSIP